MFKKRSERGREDIWLDQSIEPTTATMKSNNKMSAITYTRKIILILGGPETGKLQRQSAEEVLWLSSSR